MRASYASAAMIRSASEASSSSSRSRAQYTAARRLSRSASTRGRHANSSRPTSAAPASSAIACVVLRVAPPELVGVTREVEAFAWRAAEASPASGTASCRRARSRRPASTSPPDSRDHR